MARERMISDSSQEAVTGGVGGWQRYARGSYTNMGNYIVYTVAGGDVLSGIAVRFGVTEPQLEQWNNLKSDVLQPGQKLTIYPVSIR